MAVVLKGCTKISLDGKGRLTLPIRYREAMGADDIAKSGLIITMDPFDQCLLIYTISAWEKIQNGLINLPNIIGGNREIQRAMLGFAEELPVDAAGRVILSLELRAAAELDRSAVMVGQINKLELWSERLWNQRREGSRAQANEMRQNPSLELTQLIGQI